MPPKRKTSEPDVNPSKKQDTKNIIYCGTEPEFEGPPKYYTHKENQYTCEDCGNQFLGKNAAIGVCSMRHNYWTIECPKCEKYADAIPFATWEQIMKYDPDEKEREKAVKRVERDRKRDVESLKKADQLVDIDNDNIVITLHMETMDDEYMLIKYKDVILWKQPAYPGNLDNYFKVRNVLEDKYGDKISKIVFNAAVDQCLHWD